MHEENDKPRIGPARNAARAILKRCKIKEAPVSLRVIISHLQQAYDLDVHLCAGFTDKFSGMLVTVETKETGGEHNEIHINSEHHWRRRRFTIAHEIGHLYMNTTCSDGTENLFDGKTTFELEADAFAAELLMPLSFLNKDLKTGGVSIPDLAWKYIVSQEAMGWKVSASNLLSKF
jgi:hypothetical protein